MLVIAFGLGGQSEFQDRQGEQLSFTTNHTTVSIFQEGEGKRIYAAEPVQQLRLMVSESALVRYIGEERSRQLLGPALAHNESFRQLAFGSSGPSEHLRYFKSPAVLQQDGLSQRIHALSLLSEQLQILAPPPTSSEQLSTKDIDKLEHVEAYLHAHLDKPLNNAYLCAALGISEYRLKECFRQAYGTSPAQHLLEIRMHRAREMLAAGYQVSETAYRVGYQYPGNFSAAFLRFFGCAPKSVRGKRS
ncbi:helix-turn-helix domain-containing protein [Pseudomonas chlororaphis]|uniref:AraC family transcriptional regulator n=1 Tax=Pseudomonas chlororaphis TaxID=587753 RepID=UPI0030D33D5E